MLDLNRAALIACALAGLCLSFAACTNGANQPGGDIATVNGQKISRADFDRKLEAGPAGKSALTQLIQTALIEQYATANKISVSDADVTKSIDAVKVRYPAGQFEQILAQQGLTEDDAREIFRGNLIIKDALAPNVTVSEGDIKAYFAKNHAQFDTPEEVQVRQILVADQKTADDIEAKLKAGGDFAALAKQFSTDPASKDKGGEYGFIRRGQMVPAFETAAFAGAVGAISAPVKSPFGWHVIQVEAKKPATHATLASAHDQIRDELLGHAETQHIPAFLQHLQENAQITITDDRLKDVAPPSGPAPTK
jgi:foldase protein PrsA